MGFFNRQNKADRPTDILAGQKKKELQAKGHGFSFKIGGEAGYGIMSIGLTFSKIASRSGYNVFDYSEYPSIIRGGHNVMQTVFSSEPVRAQLRHTDFLVALNQETVDLHKHELIPNSGVLFDGEQNIKVDNLPAEVKLYSVPLNRLAREAGGSEIMRNTAAMGAVIGLLGGSMKHLKDLIAEEFADKDIEITNKNHAVCQAGYDYVQNNYKDSILDVLKAKPKSKAQIVVNGSEAVSLGSISAGVQFIAIYPMTPISGILHTLAPLQEQYKFIYKQPEDEIAAINMAIGASFAGARAMTASSGGGFCLMVEGYGLAGMTETPLVIIEGMRGGPATGLPTWTEQGDLRFVLHCHQGEFPKIILAAGDIEESFHLTMQAFNLADKYQTPVVVMVDKQICESHKSVTPFNFKEYKISRGQMVTKSQANYQRYGLSEDGISMRAIPGSGNHFIANSDEHDEIGYSIEDEKHRKEQMEKRMSKLETCRQFDMDKPRIYGPENAALSIISWGSNKGAILDAMREFSNVNFMHLTWVNPFPTEEVANFLRSANKVLNIECNYSGQMSGLIKERTGFEITNNLLRSDGRSFFPEEIMEELFRLLNK